MILFFCSYFFKLVVQMDKKAKKIVEKKILKKQIGLDQLICALAKWCCPWCDIAKTDQGPVVRGEYCYEINNIIS